MTKDQEAAAASLARAKERLADAARNAALHPAHDPGHGVFQSALAMAERNVVRAQQRFDIAMAPKLKRDPAAELSVLLREHQLFDVGYISHSRSGDTPYPSAKLVDAASALAKLQKHLQNGVRAYIRARTHDGGYGKTFTADQRMKSILSLRLSQPRLSL